VEALTQGGPAEACQKLQTGDILQSIDGSPVSNMTDRKTLYIKEPNLLWNLLEKKPSAPFNSLFLCILQSNDGSPAANMTLSHVAKEPEV